MTLAFGTLAGCGSSDEEPRLPPPRPAVEPLPVRRPPEPPARGPLTASTLGFEGFEVPVGFTQTASYDRTRIFEGNAEAPRVVAYVRDQLERSTFEELGDGGVFRSAVPKGADATRVRLTVRIVSLAPRRTSIQIDSAILEAAPPASEEERIRQFNESLRRLD